MNARRVSLYKALYGATSMEEVNALLARYRKRNNSVITISKNNATEIDANMKRVYDAAKRKAYGKRRAEYLKMYSRKVFERDHWTCAKCGETIANKDTARAYNLIFKYGGENTDMSPFVTLCRTCYNTTVETYATDHCDCVRKHPLCQTCSECMTPPTLEEMVREKIGEGMTRWLNLEI